MVFAGFYTAGLLKVFGRKSPLKFKPEFFCEGASCPLVFSGNSAAQSRRAYGFAI
jgi:hypothetical protein